MKLKLFEGEALIGVAEVFALDPPMRVAMAKFEAAAGYDPKRHANVLDGEYLGDRTERLRVEMRDGSALKCAAISIQDFPTLAEREVYLHEIVEPPFDELFADHPSFTASWGKG